MNNKHVSEHELSLRFLSTYEKSMVILSTTPFIQLDKLCQIIGIDFPYLVNTAFLLKILLLPLSTYLDFTSDHQLPNISISDHLHPCIFKRRRKCPPKHNSGNILCSTHHFLELLNYHSSTEIMFR